MFASQREALEYIHDHDIAMVDLKIVGIAGQWLHMSVPARRFQEAIFEEGIGYDGSSGAGYANVESGDMAARPDPSTAFLDPFADHPTLSFLCDTVSADTKEPCPSNPRTIARRAAAYMRETGIADEALMAPEFEFYLFDRVEVSDEAYRTGVSIRSAEVHSDGTTPVIANKRGYGRVPPVDQLHNIRSDIALTLERLGVPVRYHHHEVGAPGQCEIEVDLTPMVNAADQAMLIKYVIKNLAQRHGRLATFMPKPVYGEAGNGMHVHQKLDKGGKPLFYDFAEKNYANLSETALHYTAGLLSHGRALAAITSPSTNSFKRLVEGYEAPVNLFYSLGNRSAAIRVPRYAVRPEEKRIEYRPPDASGNIYLTLASMLMAGLDGIIDGMDPARLDFGPFDVDMAQQDAALRSRITPLPRSLHDALQALEKDHEFLLKGNVFSKAFVEAWIAGKRANESDLMAARPHPFEYQLYLDV